MKSDAVGAGIDPEGFSPHSLRKFFATALTEAVGNPRLTDILMRHSLGVQGAYYRPELESQHAALCKMPSVWTQKSGYSSPTFKRAGAGSDRLPSATPMNTHVHKSQSPAAASAIGVASNPRASAGLSALSGEPGDAFGQSDTVIGVSAGITGADPIAVAELLESVARLLRGR